MWRGSIQILVNDVADPLKRAEEKRQEWSEHLPSGTEAQQEEVLPPMKIEELLHASRNYKTSTGAGTDGSHPKLPLDLTQEGYALIVDILTNVEQCGF